MKVGEIDIKWDMGYEAASDLLEAIQVVCGSGIRKVEGSLFEVTKHEQGIRVDIDKSFYEA